jgi:hypothetical protein
VSARVVPTAAASAVPFVEWRRITARLKRDFEPGMHVTAIGPTGCGKTTVLFAVVELASSWTLVLGTKRNDPLLEALTWRGYQRISSVKEIMWADATPLHERYLFWPRTGELGARERVAFQAARMREALDFAERSTNWLVVADELHYLTKHLHLDPELSYSYFQGRTQHVSILGAAQRPVHVPLYALNQPGYFFIFGVSDRRDLDRLAELNVRFPRELINRAVIELDYSSHECLFVDVHGDRIARTVAPAAASSPQREQSQRSKVRIGS